MKQSETEEILVCGPFQGREVKTVMWEQVAQVAFAEGILALF